MLESLKPSLQSRAIFKYEAQLAVTFKCCSSSAYLLEAEMKTRVKEEEGVDSISSKQCRVVGSISIYGAEWCMPAFAWRREKIQCYDRPRWPL